MSYILDALRRADAERSRGTVPGLHAQSLPDAEPAARNYRPIAWIAGGAGAVMIAVAAIVVFGPWRPRAPVAAVPPLAPAPELARAGGADAGPAYPAGATPPARAGELAPAARPVEPPLPARGDDRAVSPDARTPSPGVQAAADGMPPSRATREPTAGADAAADRIPSRTAQGRTATAAAAGRELPPGVPPRLDRRAEDGRVAVLEPRAAARNEPPAPSGQTRSTRDDGAAPASPYARATATTAADAAAAPAAVEHYGPPVAASPAPAARAAAVPNINDLPPAVKAGLPRLAVGGSIYSEVPAARMVILNGQVFHEGDHPAPDTVVEQIRLKSTVLSTRGQRYEITF